LQGTVGLNSHRIELGGDNRRDAVAVELADFTRRLRNGKTNNRHPGCEGFFRSIKYNKIALEYVITAL
jgi:hypothetical protein